MKRKETPVACERCGSMYFQEAEFRQYRGGMYSSGAGGELSQLTDAPSFNQCVEKAKAHRARQQPEALLQELLATLATKKELAEAQERLANIKLAMQAITLEAIKSNE